MKILTFLSLFILFACSNENTQQSPSESLTAQKEPVEEASDATSRVEENNETRLGDQKEDQIIPEVLDEGIRKPKPKKESMIQEEPSIPAGKPEVELLKETNTPPPPMPIMDFSKVYGQILNEYVSADGKVNYKGLLSNKEWLGQAISHFQQDSPNSSWSKNKTKAYWINAYNLFTLKLIVDHYPVKSILDISNGKPWDDRFIEINGKKLSLNDIENNILRKDFSDPRIHFAINCASISCPKLLNEPYTESNLNTLLDTQAKRYLLDSQQNYLSKDKLEIAEIFNWFKEDFKVVGGVTAFIEKQTGKEISEKAKITYKKYNWNLNE